MGTICTCDQMCCLLFNAGTEQHRNLFLSSMREDLLTSSTELLTAPKRAVIIDKDAESKHDDQQIRKASSWTRNQLKQHQIRRRTTRHSQQKGTTRAAPKQLNVRSCGQRWQCAVQMQATWRSNGGRGMGGRGVYRNRNAETWKRFFDVSDPKQIEEEADAKEFLRLLVDQINFRKDVKTVVYQLVSAHEQRTAMLERRTRSASAFHHPCIMLPGIDTQFLALLWWACPARAHTIPQGLWRVALAGVGTHQAVRFTCRSRVHCRGNLSEGCEQVIIYVNK
jgi:hypothetical protein